MDYHGLTYLTITILLSFGLKVSHQQQISGELKKFFLYSLDRVWFNTIFFSLFAIILNIMFRKTFLRQKSIQVFSAVVSIFVGNTGVSSLGAFSNFQLMEVLIFR